MKKNLNEAVIVLLDKSYDEGSRDDIAMDFSASDDYKVFHSLLLVAMDQNDSEIVRESCVESLCQILNRNIDNKIFLDSIGNKQLMNALNFTKENYSALYAAYELNELE